MDISGIIDVLRLGKLVDWNFIGWLNLLDKMGAILDRWKCLWSLRERIK